MKLLPIALISALALAVGCAEEAPPQPADPHAGHGTEGPAPEATPPDPDDIAYWTCPMHPSVQSEEQSSCPICGMDLTPVTHDSLATGTVVIDDLRRQALGIRTATVARGALTSVVRAPGIVAPDPALVTEVTVRVEGFVEDLHVTDPGTRVRRGQPLFSLYSPALYAAQEELIQASSLAGGDLGLGGLADAARRRLELWGLTEAQVAAIAARGEPRRTVDILAPTSGWIVEKAVVEGAQVGPGEPVYRIAELDPVWVEAQVYEADLPQVAEGQAVTVSLPFVPGRTFEGTVAQVVPWLDPDTRTGTVRVVLANPDLALKPDMYADVNLEAALGEALVIPREAVIYAGERRIVFVDLGGGRLQPREVHLGRRGDEGVEVLHGLEPGDVIVTSGNFLVAAESRLRTASELWGGTEGGTHVH